MVERGAAGAGQMVAEVAELAKMAAHAFDQAPLQEMGPAQLIHVSNYAGPHVQHLSPIQWRGLFPCLHNIQKVVTACDGAETGGCKVSPVHSFAAYLG